MIPILFFKSILFYKPNKLISKDHHRKFLIFILLIIPIFDGYTFQENYESGNFRECVKELTQAASRRKLNETELFFLGECYFQIREFAKAAFYFDSLLKKNWSDGRRLVSRLIDIYQKTEDTPLIENVIQWLEENPAEEYQLVRLRNLFLQNGNIESFLRLYRLKPYYLDEATWKKLFLLPETTIRSLIEIYPALPQEKDLLLIRYLYFKGDTDTALKMLKEHPERHNREFRFLLFEILAANYQKDEAIAEILAVLKQDISATLNVAEMLFEKGYTAEAIEVLESAEKKGIFYLERKIFFLTAAQKNREAVLELEKARYSGKISEYQYLQIRNDILQAWNTSAYLATLSEFSDKIPGSCRTIVELGSQHISLLDDQKLLNELLNCSDLLIVPRRSSTLQMLYENKRYQVLLQLLEKDKTKDRFEQFTLLKSYYQLREYKKATQLASLIQQDITWLNRSEFRYYQGKISLAMKRFDEATFYFQDLQYEDAPIFYLESLLASRNWQALEKAANNISSPYTRERKYYQAIWSLSQRQSQQASVLLEEYLKDPGIYGIRAVHLLFVLKYFSDEELNTVLATNLALYPDYLKAEDWILLTTNIQELPESEFEAYCLYWQARTLIARQSREKALAILNRLRNAPAAAYLQEEIFYLTENHSNNNLDFIRRFPSSPFRILGNP